MMITSEALKTSVLSAVAETPRALKRPLLIEHGSLTYKSAGLVKPARNIPLIRAEAYTSKFKLVLYFSVN